MPSTDPTIRPSDITGSYQGYKADTNWFTAWVASKAVNCGYSVDGHQSEKKGKSKQMSKNPAVTKIPVQQLVDQAQFLVKKQPGLVVPRDVINAGSRAIRARTKYLNWFRGAFATTPEFQRSNDRHAHFIDVLTSALGALQPYAEREPSSANTRDTGRQSLNALANTFRLLEVEDCREENDDIPSTNSPSSHSKPEAKVTQPTTNKGIHSEWLFEAYCAFEDFNAIREHLQQIWKAYDSKTINLVTASAVTEVAFHFMAVLEESTIHLYDDASDKDLRMVWEDLCIAKAEDPKQQPDLDGAMRGDFEWLCLDTMQSIDRWKIARPFQASLRSEYGNYDPTADRSQMSAIQKHKEDCVILARIIWDTIESGHLRKWQEKEEHWFFEDKVTKSLRDFYRESSSEPSSIPRSSIWLGFGVKIILDIHHILRSKVDQPFKHLLVAIKVSKSMLESYVKFSHLPSDEFEERWTCDDAETLRGHRNLVHDIEEDTFGELKKDMNDSGKPGQELELIPNSPFSQNPVLCGLFTLGTDIHRTSIGVRSHYVWLTMETLAHLYNALKQNQHLSMSWPRMETLIRIHTPEYLFHGGAPSDLKECLAKSRLWAGVSAKLFASDAEVPEIVKPMPKRSLQDHWGPICQAFKKYYFPLKDEESDDRQLLSSLLRAFVSKQPKQKSSEAPGYLELLQFVQENLPIEMEVLKFNYTAFAEECAPMLRALYAEFKDDFASSGLESTIDEKNMVLNTVQYILKLSLMEADLFESWKIRGWRSLHLRRAAEVMERLLRKK